jgi:hypothetical protein
MRCMISYHKKGRNTFSSIEDVIQVPIANKIMCPCNIKYTPWNVITNLYDRFIANNQLEQLIKYVQISVLKLMHNFQVLGILDGLIKKLQKNSMDWYTLRCR